MSPLNSVRTFIAIEVPAQIRGAIKSHIDQLRAEFPDVRASWSREDNLHLTLKFLGEVAVERITSLSEALAGAALTIGPFELGIGRCGTFPPQGKPKVLWIGCADETSASLISLHKAIEGACAATGFARDARPYHPHLTIARLREAKGARALAEAHTKLGFAPRTFPVSEVVLFRSQLSSKGSVHTVLSRHGLGNRR